MALLHFLMFLRQLHTICWLTAYLTQDHDGQEDKEKPRKNCAGQLVVWSRWVWHITTGRTQTIKMAAPSQCGVTLLILGLLGIICGSLTLGLFDKMFDYILKTVIQFSKLFQRMKTLLHFPWSYDSCAFRSKWFWPLGLIAWACGKSYLTVFHYWCMSTFSTLQTRLKFWKLKIIPA